MFTTLNLPVLFKSGEKKNFKAPLATVEGKANPEYYKIYFFTDTNTIWYAGTEYGSTASDRIAALETVVGDLTNPKSGLVKGVADNTSAISALQTLLGESQKGESEKTVVERLNIIETLVTAAADKDGTIENLTEIINWFNGVVEKDGAGAELIATVAKLNGDATTAGSVAEAKKAADDANTAIGTDDTANTVKGRIKALETAAQTDAVTVSATDGVTKNSVTYKYTHPTTTATDAAFVKVGKDAQGHVVLGNAVAKADITGLIGTGVYDADGAAAAVQGDTTSTVKDLVDEIGTDATAGTVKGRIKALEGGSISIAEATKASMEGNVTADAKVKVSVTTENGSVKAVAVTTNDIASAAKYKTDVTDKLLGAATVSGSVAEAKAAADAAQGDATAALDAIGDDETEGTVNYRIAALETVNSSRDLTVNDTAVATQYVSSVSQGKDGKITVNRADLPTLTALVKNGDAAAAADTSLIEVSNHQITLKVGDLANVMLNKDPETGKFTTVEASGSGLATVADVATTIAADEAKIAEAFNAINTRFNTIDSWTWYGTF